MKKQVVLSHTKQIMTPDGELIEQDVSKTYTIKLDENDRFFMVYYNMLKSFYQIKYVKDVMLLVKLVELADHNTGIVTIAAKTREELCRDLQVSKFNLSPMFKRLLDLELISGDKGVYTINLRSVVDIKVLTKFCIMAGHNTGKVVLSTAERQDIMTILNISTQQLTNSICSLRKNGLLEGDRGTYIINPAVFWKGKNDTRNELLQSMEVSLSLVFNK